MLSIIIPVYNKIEITISCIQKNIIHCEQKSEWIIIDNNSDEATKAGLLQLKKFAEEKNHTFTIIHETENTGTARAWNTGLAKATGTYIVILNNDCVLMPHWDTATIKEIETGKLELFTPFIIEPPMLKNKYNESDFWEGKKNWNYYLQKNKRRICNGIFGGVVFAAKKETFAKIGLFDSKFWLTLDDMDYIYKAMKMGIKTGISGNIIGFHHVSSTRKEMNINEQVAVNYFKEKWNCDYAKQENSFWNKLKRSYRKKLFLYTGKLGRINMILK
ncbi:MAG: glycosyltransferase [Bacteroidota bacterium]|nr:glycosyltransferase [Bacteroidota bacterium]